MAQYHYGSWCQPQVSITCIQLNRSALLLSSGEGLKRAVSLAAYLSQHRRALGQADSISAKGLLLAKRTAPSLCQPPSAEGGEAPVLAPMSGSAQKCSQAVVPLPAGSTHVPLALLLLLTETVC